MAKKKGRVPKRIAGFKVPKDLRKTAEQVLDLADNPAVRQLASAALMSAAAALTEKRADKADRRQRDVGSDHGDPAAEVRREAVNLANAIRMAAAEGVRRAVNKDRESRGGNCH